MNHSIKEKIHEIMIFFEPQSKKTGLWGFPPGLTQNCRVEPKKQARSMKFRIQEEEGSIVLYHSV